MLLHLFTLTSYSTTKSTKLNSTHRNTSHNRRNVFRDDMRRLGEAKTTESDRICPLSRPVLVYAHTHSCEHNTMLILTYCRTKRKSINLLNVKGRRCPLELQNDGP